MYYIRDYGYGRSKRRRSKIIPIMLSVVTLALGTGGVAIRVLADDRGNLEQITELVPEVPAKKAELMPETLPEIKEEPIVPKVEPDVDLVVLDPGHGGTDEGCSRDGVLEKDINLQIAVLLKDRLQQMGYEVLMTREGDEPLSLEQRVEKANEAAGDIYISIHQNACEELESEVNGIETFYSGKQYDEDSRRLAQLIHSDVILYTDKKDRGIRKEDDLYVIRETGMPSCLIETGFLSNREERKDLTDEAFQQRIVEGIASGVDLYFHPKTMYLTFDDGPSPKYTEQILDVLKEKDIKATFFVVGENVRKHPEIARRIVEEGHAIGIHCNWHDYDTLYESVDSYVADFERAYQMVYEVTGVETKLFRFPGGSINAFNKNVYESIIEEMTAKGFVYFDWNASLEDAVTRSTQEELLQNAKTSTLGRKRVVLLAHDIVENTALCLETLIEQFPEYQFEPLTAEVTPIQF